MAYCQCITLGQLHETFNMYDTYQEFLDARLRRTMKQTTERHLVAASQQNINYCAQLFLRWRLLGKTGMPTKKDK